MKVHRTRHGLRPRLAATALGLLAAGAVAACSEPGGPPVSQNPLADSAEQVMFGVTAALHAAGVNKGSLRSDSAFFFESGTRMELFGVHITFFDAVGTPSGNLTAERGTYRPSRRSMTARQNVVVTNVEGRRLETPELHFDEAINQISSDSTFVVSTPGGERLEGIGFTSDPHLNVVRITRATSGSAGAVSVPDR